VTAHHFARAGLLEPLSRTFMGLEFRHRNSVDLLQQVRLKNYSTAGRTRLNPESCITQDEPGGRPFALGVLGRSMIGKQSRESPSAVKSPEMKSRYSVLI
jgi:hypothetical protein